MDIDLTQVLLYMFWIFFAGLIYYLQREMQREGYPVEIDEEPGRYRPKSLLFFPAPKTFLFAYGGSRSAPDDSHDRRPVPGVPIARFPGAAIEPTSPNPMLDSIGPGSWAERADTPDLTYDGRNKIVPMRVAPTYYPAHEDPDPRGYDVVGCDGVVGGKVMDIWVDRSEAIARYLEIEVMRGGTPRRALLPMNFVKFAKGPARIEVKAITGTQFADAPGFAQPDRVTLLEEEKICAYYGAGTLYATPSRQEPLL
jgi:photosynthetic reaction center H subunit